jgi:hypothetical protein
MKTKNQLVSSFAALSVFILVCLGIPRINTQAAPAKQGVKLPFTIYDDKGGTNNHYSPSGWMGNTKGIKMDDGCTNKPHGGKTCLRFQYTENGDWAGVVWQDPVNDWGEKAGGWNLTGAKKLSFWAHGETGGESLIFKFGVLGGDKKFSDSSGGELDDVKLTKDWKQYSIELTDKDLTSIKTGFAWTVAGQGRPVTFYLDDILFE